MSSQETSKPPLTPERARRIDSAFEERSAARSLSIGARAFRGLTDIIAETRSSSIEDDSSASITDRLGNLFS